MLKDARRQREDGAGDPFAEAQRSYESEIAAQKADIKRLKVRPAFSATRRPLVDAQLCLALLFVQANLKELDARYRHEFLLVFAAYQDLGSKMQREHLRGERRDVQPSSWLAQQRKKVRCFACRSFLSLLLDQCMLTMRSVCFSPKRLVGRRSSTVVNLELLLGLLPQHFIPTTLDLFPIDSSIPSTLSHDTT